MYTISDLASDNEINSPLLFKLVYKLSRCFRWHLGGTLSILVRVGFHTVYVCSGLFLNTNELYHA